MLVYKHVMYMHLVHKLCTPGCTFIIKMCIQISDHFQRRKESLENLEKSPKVNPLVMHAQQFLEFACAVNTVLDTSHLISVRVRVLLFAN